MKTIYHARKSLLFNKDNLCVKKDNPKFYLTMGSYDSTEFCQLVGLYLLNLLTKVLGKQNIGLYRNDGLNCFENILDFDSEKVKKKIFKKNGLSIIVACNLIVTDFLGVTFDLEFDTFYPYLKPKSIYRI